MKGRYLYLVPLTLLFLMIVILMAAPASHATGSLTGKSICLDPGHGGVDPGATNGDLQEKSINLDVSMRLRELLVGENAVVFMTREDDESYLTNSDRYTYCNAMQDEDYESILVSVHTNSVVDDTWDGANTLYGPREDPALAQAIHERMYPFLRDTRPAGIPEEEFINFGVDKFASGVLFKSNMPAAMVEPLFMSNSLESPLLVQSIYDSDGSLCVNVDGVTPCRREQIAQAIFSGIKNYFAEPQLIRMNVTRIEMAYQPSRSFYFITTDIRILEDGGNPVAGALVTFDIAIPGSRSVTRNIVTEYDGWATYTLRSKATGTYVSTVIDVNKNGFTYEFDADDNQSLVVP